MGSIKMTTVRSAGPLAAILVAAAALTASCSSSSHPTAPPPTTVVTVPATGAPARAVCGNAGHPAAHYSSVVVFSFENRTWNDVGNGFGPKMPYLHTLGQRCSWFPDWTETNTAQNSLTQYVGQVTGAFESRTVND